MGSMFIVAGGLSRTQMVHRVTNLAYKVSGGSFQKGMILYCLVTLAIAQVAPSAILIFSICYPLVSDFCRKNNQSPSKAMFSIVLICICTVTSLPIGSGATSYITANTMWETYGVTAREGMFDPMLVLYADTCSFGTVCDVLLPEGCTRITVLSIQKFS